MITTNYDYDNDDGPLQLPGEMIGSEAWVKDVIRESKRWELDFSPHLSDMCKRASVVMVAVTWQRLREFCKSNSSQRRRRRRHSKSPKSSVNLPGLRNSQRTTWRQGKQLLRWQRRQQESIIYPICHWPEVVWILMIQRQIEWIRRTNKKQKPHLGWTKRVWIEKNKENDV